MCDDGKIAPSKMACVVELSHDCLRGVFLAVRLGSHLLVKRQKGKIGHIANNMPQKRSPHFPGSSGENACGAGSKANGEVRQGVGRQVQ